MSSTRSETYPLVHVPDVRQTSTQTSVSVWPKDFSKPSLVDWGWFTAGFVVGLFVSLATSSFSMLFDPCLVQWASVFASGFFFYLYMAAYMDANFDNNQVLLMMILSFVQMGMALNQGSCDSDHGFQSSQGLHTVLGTFTLDHDEVMEMQYAAEKAINHYFGTFGQTQNGEAPEVDTNTATGIMAIIGIYGLLQLIQAYAGWVSFVTEFDQGDYFESGSFLGKALIDLASVAYLILLAIAVSKQQQ